jgi:hypothetical protein
VAARQKEQTGEGNRAAGVHARAIVIALVASVVACAQCIADLINGRRVAGMLGRGAGEVHCARDRDPHEGRHRPHSFTLYSVLVQAPRSYPTDRPFVAGTISRDPSFSTRCDSIREVTVPVQ